MGNLGDLQNEEKKNSHDDLNWKKYKFITEETFGDKLLTQWHGMSITRDKRCSLIRKWHSMITAFCYAKTAQMRTIRARMCEIMRNHGSTTDLKGVVQKLTKSQIGTDIRKACQLTFPLKVCLIEKVKVIRKPKKDVAKIMQIHDLTTGFDAIEEDEEENEEDENFSGSEDMSVASDIED